MGKVGIPGKPMRNWFPPRGGWNNDVVACFCIFGLWRFLPGAEKLPGRPESRKYAAGENRSLVGSDPAHSAATGPPVVSVTAGGGQSSGSTPGRRPMIRMLPDRKTVTALHTSQGQAVVIGASNHRGHSDTIPA
jgi:hypothetical protein